MLNDFQCKKGAAAPTSTQQENTMTTIRIVFYHMTPNTRPVFDSMTIKVPASNFWQEYADAKAAAHKAAAENGWTIEIEGTRS